MPFKAAASLVVSMTLFTLLTLFDEWFIGSGDNFSNSRTGKSFKLRKSEAFVLVDADDVLVLRLKLDDFEADEQRHVRDFVFVALSLLLLMRFILMAVLLELIAVVVGTLQNSFRLKIK